MVKMIKCKTIWHLYLKATDENKYYGSITALCSDNQELGRSKFFFDRYPFDEKPYDTNICTIRKDVMKTTGQI